MWGEICQLFGIMLHQQMKKKEKAVEVVCLRYWNKACRHGHDLLQLNFYTSEQLCDKQQKVGASLYVV